MQQHFVDEAILHFRKANMLNNNIQSLEGILEAYLTQHQTVSALELCSRVFKRAHVPRTMTLMAIVISHLPERQKEVDFIPFFKKNVGKISFSNCIICQSKLY